MNRDGELKAIYFLKQIPNIGNVRILNILNSFKNPADIFIAGEPELARVEGLTHANCRAIIQERKNISAIEEKFNELLDKCERKNINIITINDEEYPRNLKRIFNAPVMLFYKGKLSPSDEFSIGVVGTRYCSDYGRDACIKIVEELARKKIPIISGLAKGIDCVAHVTALKNHTLTYAILGCGVDVIYPAENRKVYEAIEEKGAIISEYEPGAKPDKGNFPDRNRIVSGISLGILVAETGLKGGSLLTTGFALDQNREIFAVPCSIFQRRFEGTNDMIKKGVAKLTTCAEDILIELDFRLRDYLSDKEFDNEEKVISLNMFEKTLYDVLTDEPLYIDDISEKSNLSVSDCLVYLLSLEFKSLIRQLPGKRFVKR
jgi:DNA processing protein